MNIQSKQIEKIDNINFTILKPSPLPPMIGLPRAAESIAIYKNEVSPPEKSSKTFARLHPTVDFLL